MTQTEQRMREVLTQITDRLEQELLVKYARQTMEIRRIKNPSDLPMVLDDAKAWIRRDKTISAARELLGESK